MTAGRKLAIGGLAVATATACLAYWGGAASWQYYVTVDEGLANAAALSGTRIRVRGKIAPNTLRIALDRDQATFCLEGTEQKLPVVCFGPLPDHLAEGVDVVVEGRLDPAGLLRGQKVLTRCAGKYRSRPARHGPEYPGRAEGKGGR